MRRCSILRESADLGEKFFFGKRAILSWGCFGKIHFEAAEIQWICLSFDVLIVYFHLNILQFSELNLIPTIASYLHV